MIKVTIKGRINMPPEGYDTLNNLLNKHSTLTLSKSAVEPGDMVWVESDSFYPVYGTVGTHTLGSKFVEFIPCKGHMSKISKLVEDHSPYIFLVDKAAIGFTVGQAEELYRDLAIGINYISGLPVNGTEYYAVVIGVE